jgi:uridine nucleosidase
MPGQLNHFSAMPFMPKLFTVLWSACVVSPSSVQNANVDMTGESGLDGVTLLPTPRMAVKTDVSCIEAMYRALSNIAPNTAYLITTGAMTNAGALFATYPDLADHLAGMSIMGGAIGNNFTPAPMGHVKGEGERFGNWTPYAEFNIYCDPEAAASVFENEVLAKKTTLIPLDVTHLCLATKEARYKLLYGFDPGTDSVEKTEDRNSIMPENQGNKTVTEDANNGPSPVRALFHQVLTFFAQTYADVFALTEGPPLHDPLAVTAVFEPAIFHDEDGERFAVSIVTNGIHSNDTKTIGQLGRTVATLLPKGEEGVRIPRNLDSNRIWQLLELALEKAEAASQVRALTNDEKSMFPPRNAYV